MKLEFTAAYALLDHLEDYGTLVADSGDASMDYWYFSFVAYTSLGFGDITPSGSLRFMTALETLTGLVLIAWTASFIFLQMQAHWEPGRTAKPGQDSVDNNVNP